MFYVTDINVCMCCTCCMCCIVVCSACAVCAVCAACAESAASDCLQFSGSFRGTFWNSRHFAPILRHCSDEANDALITCGYIAV